MGTDVQVVSDGEGIAIFGDAGEIDSFLAPTGLPSRELDLSRLSGVLSAGSSAAQAGSQIASQSGRWVKLTKESADAMSKLDLMKGSSSETARMVLMDKGKISGLMEIVRPGQAASLFTNPAILAGAAGIMAQVAMQQTMDEITDYLAVIDEKVDDILRSQKDSVLADMIGVQLVIDEAMHIRERVGRVSDVTWSKVQSTSLTIARTQGYALRQLDGLAEKLERKSAMGDLAKAARDAEDSAQEWLAVLARCFQLQDAIAVLELDRVLDAEPEELDRHREALVSARQNRRDLIAKCTERLLARMDAAAGTANSKVLLHPSTSKAVVQSSNSVAMNVVGFHATLGIESSREALAAKPWRTAVTETRDKAVETGAEGVDAAQRFSKTTFNRAKSATDRLSGEITGRAPWRRGGGGTTAESATDLDEPKGDRTGGGADTDG